MERIDAVAGAEHGADEFVLISKVGVAAGFVRGFVMRADEAGHRAADRRLVEQ